MSDEKASKEKVDSNAQFAVAELATPPAVGHVKLIMKDARTGEETVLVDRKNTITQNMYETLTGLLNGDNNWIDRIAFGTNGDPEAEINNTISGAVTVPATHSYPTAGNTSVEFTGTLDAATANGMTIREIGLFFHSGTALAARISFETVTKCAYFTLSVVWSITWPTPTGGALNALRGVLARLISSGASSADFVTSIQFGTGSATPDPSNTHLQLPVAKVDVTTAVISPTDYTARFVGYLDSFTANGYTIAEAGLLTAGGILIARETFAGRYKDADHMLEFGITIRLHS